MSVLSLSYYESDVRITKRFADLAPQTAGIDMIWRNYVTVTLCIGEYKADRQTDRQTDRHLFNGLNRWIQMRLNCSVAYTYNVQYKTQHKHTRYQHLREAEREFNVPSPPKSVDQETMIIAGDPRSARSHKRQTTSFYNSFKNWRVYYSMDVNMTEWRSSSATCNVVAFTGDEWR